MTITRDVIAQVIQVNPERIREFYQNGNAIRVFLTDSQEVLTVNLDKCKPFIEENQGAIPKPQKEGTSITSWTITKGILGAIAILSLGIGAIQIITIANTDQGGEFRRMADESEFSLFKYNDALCRSSGDKQACDHVKEFFDKRKR
ncbi:hypothetical protein [Leptolyngbya sp. FACHB-1624]|uniref:hypothetical protein n=1 Tax=Leptolyngbya sp. FACHB-1624 TaxID=2692802 RepID=UPI0039E812EF